MQNLNKFNRNPSLFRAVVVQSTLSPLSLHVTISSFYLKVSVIVYLKVALYNSPQSYFLLVSRLLLKITGDTVIFILRLLK